MKSPPELWAEVSDPEVLARHLGEFGDVRITRLEPETTVVWEGDRASGTVELEPSGWGTKVTLTAELAGLEAALEAPVVDELRIEEEVVVVEEPAVECAPPAAARRSFFARLFGFDASAVPEPVVDEQRIEEAVVEEPAVEEPAVEEPAVEEPADTLESERAAEVLAGVLDKLGSAHHRPFSRG